MDKSMTQSFKKTRISELIDEIAMGPFGSNIKVSCFVDSGIPVLNGSNLVGYTLTEDDFRFVSVEKADSLKKANARRGDVIITHRGTLGQIAYIPKDSKYDRYVISQSQFRLRCNEKIRPEYLVYYFHTRTGQHKLLSNASQVGVPALARPTSTFQSIEIEVPEVSVQEKIIRVLDSINNKIALNQKINRNLEEQAQ
ncbi:MAG: restriction endonuclease subunit S, partial [Thermoguttaceae bacterium]|nr:restriction endonuclease subunit S [Thermoguttaceae bacterium]